VKVFVAAALGMVNIVLTPLPREALTGCTATPATAGNTLVPLTTVEEIPAAGSVSPVEFPSGVVTFIGAELLAGTTVVVPASLETVVPLSRSTVEAAVAPFTTGTDETAAIVAFT
jgi:hypothetical protein